jgi:hypothetical protein
MIRRIAQILALCLLGLLPTGRARAEIINWQIDIDTAGVESQVGYLDFNFSAGNSADFDPAYVTVSNFQTDGSVTGELFPINDVTGTLPGNVELDNLAPSDYTATFTYGTFLDFTLTLSVPSISGSAQFGSSFLLSTWDSHFNNLLTADGDADPGLIGINLNAPTDGVSIQNYSSGDLATVSSAPEPASFALLAAGLIGFGLFGRRRRIPGMLSSIPSHGSGQPDYRPMDWRFRRHQP